MNRRRLLLFLPICIYIAALQVGAAIAGTPNGVQDALQKAIDGPQRTPAYVKRDPYRHPLQTLEFFGMRPDMTVIEVLPEGGWYTEILAPFLHDQGHLIEATPPISSPNSFSRKMAIKYKAKLDADPAVYGRVAAEPFEPPSYMDLGAPESVDMIVTFKNIHDFMYANVHGDVSDVIALRFFQSAYGALKPGGILGVVAHRAPAGTPIAETFKLGRLPQEYVVSLAERAGFRLAGTSEVSANPKDPGTIPVWYLPPMLSQGQQDIARYKAIGEGDDMTLRFEKPGSDG
jgi:predicted methyltransferase